MIELRMQRASSSTARGKRERAFGRVLQETRKQLSLSQEELGFKSGYHRTYISFLERGLKSPSLATIMDLADTLKVPASEFLRRVEIVLGKTQQR
jgi:transcriptional regulator with XRE-family HTH domain